MLRETLFEILFKSYKKDLQGSANTKHPLLHLSRAVQILATSKVYCFIAIILTKSIKLYFSQSLP